MSNGGAVDPALAAFIISKTGGSKSPYVWQDSQLGVRSPAAVNSGLSFVSRNSNGCITAECAAGIKGGRPQIPDYLTLQGGAFGVGGAASLNILNGDIFVGVNKGNISPGYGVSAVAGFMLGGPSESEDRGQAVSEMLGGGSVQGAACVSIVCLGINQSIGRVGSNPPIAVEFGFGTPGISAGVGVSVKTIPLPRN